MEWIKQWVTPTMRNRIKPFWFWNGEMKEEEIDFQLKEMKEQGIGGAFICARQGQKVPYLNKKWYDKVAFACEKAKEYGLEVWLYDEYPYPSGMAGGEVLLEHPEAAHTFLGYQSYVYEGGKEAEYVMPYEKILYAKATPFMENGVLDYEKAIDIKEWIGNRQEKEIYQKTGLTNYNNKRFFTYEPKKVLNIYLEKGVWQIDIYTERYLKDFKYYGNYFDPCNKDVVKTFINCTYDKYKKVLGNEFGQTIFGMFSDEVGMLGGLPWSVHLPKYFKERNGYDICEVLGGIHHKDMPNAFKIRYDYYQAVHELFRESYHKQISKWCEENSILYATEVPSMRRSTQMYSHIVGGDTSHEKLGKSLEWVYDNYLPNYRTNAIGVSSLARQLNRDYAMIESFHSVGWSMTLQDAKWMFDLLGAQGINFYNVHAFYYTIDAITKHDAPPSQFIQNPYWKHYHQLADYAARLSTWVSNTTANHSVALLDPIATLWTYLGNPMHGFPYVGKDKQEERDLKKIREDWIHIAKTLLFGQIGFDFLDGEIMEKAVIKDGIMTIGKAQYSVIIVPPSAVIEEKVTKYLEEFANSGGKVVAVSLLPQQVIDNDIDVKDKYQKWFRGDDDDASLYWSQTSAKCGMHNCYEIKRQGNMIYVDTNGSVKEAGIEDAFISLIYELVNEPVRVYSDNNKEIFSSIRSDKDNLFVFVGNHGKESATIGINCKKEFKYCYELCLETGKITLIELKKDILLASLSSYISRLFLFTNNKQIEEYGKNKDLFQKFQKVDTFIIDGTKEMDVTIQGDNIFRLDTFQISLDKKRWEETEVKTFIESCNSTKILRGEHLIFSSEFGTPKHIDILYPLQVYYRQYFQVEKVPEKAKLLMDNRTINSSFTIEINGNNIQKEDFVYEFINDQNNLVCDISSYLIEGENEIFICVKVEKESDGICDPIYIIGNFGVEENKIVSMPKKGNISTVYCKGFPYYSGTFIYKTNVIVEKQCKNDVWITIKGLENNYDCIELIINGYKLGNRAFVPYGFYCKKEWLKRENVIEIVHTNTLIHMLEGSYFDYEQHKTVKI